MSRWQPSSLDRQHIERLWDGNDFVGLFRNFDLAQHEALAGYEGETMWIVGLPAFFRPEPLEVLPSIAIAPSGTPVTAAGQATKQFWNCSASSTTRMSPRWRVQACRP